MALSPRRQRFVNAYVGEAAGNASKAAVIAGYSDKAARQVASRLLTYADIQQAIIDLTQRAGFTVERAIEELSTIAEFKVDRVTSGDKLKAIELFLKAKGALRDNTGESKVIVNIGFLASHTPTDINWHQRLTQSVTTLEVGPVLGRGATLALREGEPLVE